MNYFDTLMQSVKTGRPKNALLGSGAADQAAQILISRPYQLHVQEMEAQGMRPLSPQEFKTRYEQNK